MARSTRIFGEKLKAAREKIFLTQAQLGEMLDPPMSDENIGRLERLKVAGVLSKRIPQLAAALKLTLAEFEREIVVKPNRADAVNGSGDALDQLVRLASKLKLDPKEVIKRFRKIGSSTSLRDSGAGPTSMPKRK